MARRRRPARGREPRAPGRTTAAGIYPVTSPSRTEHGVKKLRPALLMTLVAALALIANVLGWTTPLDNWLLGHRFHLADREPTGQVVVVAIDSASLAAVGTWPWPRQVHADIIDRLREFGAAEMAIDFDFSTAPTEEGDAALEAALRRAGGSVILAAFHQAASADADSGMSFNEPIPRLAAHAWLGSVNVRVDPDNAVRRFAFGEWIEGMPVLSVPALLSGRPGAIGSEFGVDFSIDAEAIDQISAIDLLDGSVDARRIAGRKVIVGATAIELRDLFEVPVFGIIPGPVLQALATETLLQQRAVVHADPKIVLGGLLTLVLIGAPLVRRLRLLIGTGLLVIAAAAIEAGALAQFAQDATAIPTGAWLLAIAGFAGVRLTGELDLRGALAAAFRRDLDRAEAVLGRVIDDSFAGVVVADHSGTIVAASRAASSILGLSHHPTLTGRKHREALPAQLSDLLAAATEQGQDSQRHEEMTITRAGGVEAILDVIASTSVLPGSRDHARAVVGSITFNDVTEQVQRTRRDAFLARFDELTGLPNRHALAERLASGGVGALLFFGLGRLKAVNDALGQGIGNLLLAAVAERARQVAGPDGFLARLAGEEFALAVAEVKPEALTVIADGLIAALSVPFEVGGSRVTVGISVGIAPAIAAAPAEAIRHADLALQAAKADSRGIAFYDAALSAQIEANRQIEVALWDAIPLGQLAVHYQPQVDLTTRRITGAEALVRWTHPVFGAVSPARFIPIAETSGLIERIGTWVLEKACRDAAEMPSDIRVAVNVSPVQFARGGLGRTVAGALAASGLDPARLELEITESLFMSATSAIEEAVADVLGQGVTFALDDFGTGYSSLGYLRRYPLRKVKIDRSFVTGLPVDLGSETIIRAVVALTSGLGMKVIAEGIESEAQSEALRRLGCAEGQGFLFGRPMPGEQLRAVLSARTSDAQDETKGFRAAV